MDNDLWPWRPPNPTLGPLGQLATGVAVVFILTMILVGAVALLSRVFG